MHKVIYLQKASDDLDRLEPQTALRILKKIHYYSLQESPLIYAKRLTEPALGQYRFRIGDYRAIFDVDKKGRIKILMILRIKHRKDIYGL